MFPSVLNFTPENPEAYNFAKNTVMIAKNTHIESAMNIAASKTIISPGCQILNEDGIVALSNGVILCDGVRLKPCLFKKSNQTFIEMNVKGPVLIGNGSFVRAKKIGPNVIIGENCKIGEGTVINANCIVLDNSVVAPNSSIPSNCIVGGCPATYISIMSEQAQGQLGSEIEMRFSEVEKSLTTFMTNRVRERENQAGGSTPSAATQNLPTPHHSTASSKGGQQMANTTMDEAAASQVNNSTATENA